MSAEAAYDALDELGVDYPRTRIVVIGGDNPVARAALLLGVQRRAPVASVDPGASSSDQFGWYARHADALIVAAGMPGLIRAEHVRPGAVVIDLTDGDVDVEAVRGRARVVRRLVPA